ncbi:MAG: STAS domain-containing protein [Thiotrichaceae bacterium]|nr:STAS domain-containing protein [Thiotrichaceae bacterium]
MSVATRITNNNSTLVISITGKFDFDLRNEFRQTYNNDAAKSLAVIVELNSTQTIDSSALGMLLNMQRSLNKADGEISIINCNPEILKIFQITHLDQKFSIK